MCNEDDLKSDSRLSIWYQNGDDEWFWLATLLAYPVTNDALRVQSCSLKPGVALMLN